MTKIVIQDKNTRYDQILESKSPFLLYSTVYHHETIRFLKSLGTVLFSLNSFSNQQNFDTTAQLFTKQE